MSAAPMILLIGLGNKVLLVGVDIVKVLPD